MSICLTLTLAFVDLPVSVRVESHLQKAVLGIVALAAAGADEIAAPSGSLAVVVFSNGEGGSAAAWDQEHAERLGSFGGSGGRKRVGAVGAGRPRHSWRDPSTALRAGVGATRRVAARFHDSSTTA
jgi:hypothetical protein